MWQLSPVMYAPSLTGFGAKIAKGQNAVVNFTVSSEFLVAQNEDVCTECYVHIINSQKNVKF